MNWSQNAIDALDLFLRDVPKPYLERAKRHAIDEIEEVCREQRIREVGYDQAVVGYIRSTPAHLRMGLRNSLRAKGVLVEKYEQHFMSP